LVVFGLIPFHAALIFDSIPEDFHVTSPEPNVGFTVVVGWAALWGIPLLFMVAGMGVRYALEARSDRVFAVERVRRLLVPFLFGVVVLVPRWSGCSLQARRTHTGSRARVSRNQIRAVPRV
jgi:hypothetical protein